MLNLPTLSFAFELFGAINFSVHSGVPRVL